MSKELRSLERPPRRISYQPDLPLVETPPLRGYLRDKVPTSTLRPTPAGPAHSRSVDRSRIAAALTTTCCCDHRIPYIRPSGGLDRLSAARDVSGHRMHLPSRTPQASHLSLAGPCHEIRRTRQSLLRGHQECLARIAPLRDGQVHPFTPMSLATVTVLPFTKP